MYVGPTEWTLHEKLTYKKRWSTVSKYSEIFGVTNPIVLLTSVLTSDSKIYRIEPRNSEHILPAPRVSSLYQSST